MSERDETKRTSWWKFGKSIFGSSHSVRQRAYDDAVADRNHLAADFAKVTADFHASMAKLTMPLPAPVPQTLQTLQTSQVTSPPGTMRLIHWGSLPSSSSYLAGATVTEYRPFDHAEDPKRFWAWIDQADGCGWKAIEENHVVQSGEVLSFQPPAQISEEETEQLQQSFISLRRSLDNMGDSDGW